MAHVLAAADGLGDLRSLSSCGSALLPPRAPLHSLPDDAGAVIDSFLTARDLVGLSGASSVDKARVRDAGASWLELLSLDFGVPVDAFRGKFVRHTRARPRIACASVHCVCFIGAVGAWLVEALSPQGDMCRCRGFRERCAPEAFLAARLDGPRF